MRIYRGKYSFARLQLGEAKIPLQTPNVFDEVITLLLPVFEDIQKLKTLRIGI